MRGRQREPAIVEVRREIFGIGLIDHQQDVRAETRMEPRDFARIEPAADRIVGIVEQDHPRPLGHGGEQRIDIGAVLPRLRQHRLGPDLVGEQGIEREGIARERNLVARSRESLHRAMQQLARPGSAHDPRRIDPVKRPDRRAQFLRIGIGIEGGRMGRGQRVDHRGAAPQRVLVGGQFDEFAPVGGFRLAGDIGMDRVDPGFGCGAIGHDALRHKGKQAFDKLGRNG